MLRSMSAKRENPPDVARAWLDDQGTSILEEQVELARVPAPPFQERTRGDAIASKLGALGLAPQFDELGNLLAWIPPDAGPAGAPPVIVAAHMDTVFGADVAIEIRCEGDRWVGPGITDNARGLAVALAVLRAMLRFHRRRRRARRPAWRQTSIPRGQPSAIGGRVHGR